LFFSDVVFVYNCFFFFFFLMRGGKRGGGGGGGGGGGEKLFPFCTFFCYHSTAQTPV